MMEQSEYPQFGYNLKREDTMEFLKSALDKTCRQPVLSDISFAFMLFFRFQIAFGFSHFFSTMWNNEFTVEIFVILFFFKFSAEYRLESAKHSGTSDHLSFHEVCRNNRMSLKEIEICGRRFLFGSWLPNYSFWYKRFLCWICSLKLHWNSGETI